MKTILVVLFLLIATGSGAEDPESKWTKTDSVFQAATITLMAADWRQTSWMMSQYRERKPGWVYWGPEQKYKEVNPLLGDYPDQAKINTYFIATIIGHTAVARLLLNPYRRIWQGVFIVTEAGFVAHNFSVGARIEF